MSAANEMTFLLCDRAPDLIPAQSELIRLLDRLLETMGDE